MTLRLSLQAPHISIKAFPTIDIPDFTIITGRNGSGKSHLLDGIVQGKILCDKDGIRVTVNPTDISSYSWANMVPQDSGVYSSENSRNEKSQILQQAKILLQNNKIIDQIRNFSQQYNLNLLTDHDLLHLTASEIDMVSGTANGTPFTTARDSIFTSIEQQFRRNNANFGAIIDTAKSLGKSIFLLVKRN